MYQAIKTSYKGATDTKGSGFIAKAFAGKTFVPYDYELSAEKNHIAAAFALAKKLHWVDTAAEFRAQWVGGGFGNDFYFVNRKGGSLRHIRRVEYEVQGLYFGKWEAVTTAETMKEAKQALHDYDTNERNYPHRIKRVRVNE